MDYALQILIPILLGIGLGAWLHNQFDASPMWTVLFAIIGMFAGIGILYKRSLVYAQKIKDKKSDNTDSYDDSQPKQS